MYLFISLSGPDGVGKSTTIKLFNKRTKYAYIVYDRDIPDQICYAKLANRQINERWAHYMCTNALQLYVILNADIDIIKQRMKDRNDSEVPEGTTLEQAVKYFEDNYKNSKQNNVLYIDNSNLSIDEVFNKIIEKLNE